MSVASEFFEKMLPYARTAANDLNIPVSVILAQWALESNYGQSSLAQRSGNYAGIKYVNSSIAYGKTGMYADYKHDMEKFLQDYTRVMKLSYYNQVRSADSVEDTIKALSASPYAESGYGGGKNLLNIIAQYDLKKYDNGVSSGGGTVVENIPVTVPAGATKAVIGFAVVAAGLAMLKELLSD